MGVDPFIVLAIAAGASFVGAGVLVGVSIRLRAAWRDEARYHAVAEELDRLQSSWSKLILEWGTTLEKLEQLAAAVEQKRRRAAASLSALDRKTAEEHHDQEPPRPLTAAEERMEIRKRLRPLGMR